jgi:alpha-D-xyloside xylohydrolase
MMRALLVDSPEDPAAWLVDLEYRIGPDLLVAPMTDPSGTRRVYLPDGPWVDFWTGEVHRGGRYLHVTSPLDRVPLFARHGALIPTTEPRDVVGDRPFGGITLLSFGAGTGQAVIHDVNGDTTVHTERSMDTLTFGATGPARIDAVRFAPVPGATAPATVVIDGAATVLTTVDGWVVATRLASTTSPAHPKGGPQR